MRFKCDCGWTICSNNPTVITCGSCGARLSISHKGLFPKHPGLGDYVALAIDRCGGSLFKQFYKWAFKKECGCEERKRRLNAWHARAIRRFGQLCKWPIKTRD